MQISVVSSVNKS